jgi:hypothetical protein
LVTAAPAWAQDTGATIAIQRLALADPGIRDLSFNELSLTLIGEPASKDFGVAVDGMATPKVKLTGEEKPVIRLYTGCANGNGKERGPAATNVATVELINLPQGSTKPVKLTATIEAKAFVPMKDINCAVLDVQ